MGMTQQEYLADREAQFNYFATHKKAETQKQLKAMEMAEQGMKAGAGGGLGGMLGGGGIGGLFGSIMGYGG